MKKAKFLRMVELTEDKDLDDSGFKIGDYFLYGQSMIGQKHNKVIGDAISYYEVTTIKNNGIEYTPVFDYMEEDKGEKNDSNSK